MAVQLQELGHQSLSGRCLHLAGRFLCGTQVHKEHAHGSDENTETTKPGLVEKEATQGEKVGSPGFVSFEVCEVKKLILLAHCGSHWQKIKGPLFKPLMIQHATEAVFPLLKEQPGLGTQNV